MRERHGGCCVSKKSSGRKGSAFVLSFLHIATLVPGGRFQVDIIKNLFTLGADQLRNAAA